MAAPTVHPATDVSREHGERNRRWVESRRQFSVTESLLNYVFERARAVFACECVSEVCARYTHRWTNKLSHTTHSRSFEMKIHDRGGENQFWNVPLRPRHKSIMSNRPLWQRFKQNLRAEYEILSLVDVDYVDGSLELFAERIVNKITRVFSAR